MRALRFLTQRRLDGRRGVLALRMLLLCFVLAGVGAFLVLLMPRRIQAMDEQRKLDSEFYQFSELFAEIYSQVRSRYVENVDSKALFEASINGMFTALDPHSSWLPPQEQEMLTKDTEGEYSGVGLQITMRDNILTVISPIAGSPAARAGIFPWDRIIEIDGKSTVNITLLEAVTKLTGPTGTKIKIKIWREGQKYDFVLTREKIKVDSVFYKELEGNIGYLRISKFQEDTADEVKKALKQFNQKNIRGLIVDVRFNPGGLLDRAVEICNFFLPKDQVIVSTKGRIPSANREYKATEDPIWSSDKPMVVLINEGSASASEIFAGAMRDTHSAVLMGPKGGHSYGKGSVQTISLLKHSLERDANGDIKPSGLRLTTAKYYTPAGTPIEHEKGIKPDIGVEVTLEAQRELLRHGLLGDPNAIEPGNETDMNDEVSTGTEETTGSLKTHQSVPAAPGVEEKIKKIIRSNQEQPAQEDEETTMTLEERLNKMKNPPPSNGAKKSEFHDVLLEEAVKYMKAIMIYQSRKAA